MSQQAELARMQAAAERASALMKVLGHTGRLMTLCHLAEGETSVGELVDKLGMSQSALSQHLGRMRALGLVETRRDGQTVYYRLADGEVRDVIESLYRIYCPSD